MAFRIELVGALVMKTEDRVWTFLGRLGRLGRLG